MDKILMDHDDVYVSATIIYAGEDEAAYVDAERTVKFTAAELLEAFTKGAVINVSRTNAVEYFMPSYCYMKDENGYIMYVAMGDDAPVYKALYAEEVNG